MVCWRETDRDEMETSDQQFPNPRSTAVGRAVCEDLERADPDFAAAPADTGVVVVDKAF